MKVESAERLPWLDPSVSYLQYMPGLLAPAPAEAEIADGRRPNPAEWRKSHAIWTPERAIQSLAANDIPPDEQDIIFDQRGKSHDILAAIVISRGLVSRAVDVVSLNIRAIDVLIAKDPPQKQRRIVLPILTDPAMHTGALRQEVSRQPG